MSSVANNILSESNPCAFPSLFDGVKRWCQILSFVILSDESLDEESQSSLDSCQPMRFQSVGLPELNDKQLQTLQEIFEDPVRSNIPWSCLTDLFAALGTIVKVKEDRICVVTQSGLRTTRAVLHRRNNEEYASTHAINNIQRFFATARIKVAK